MLKKLSFILIFMCISANFVFDVEVGDIFLQFNLVYVAQLADTLMAKT